MDPIPKQRQHEEEETSRLTLAARLREAREYLGLSQDQVAQHIGVPRSALSNVENGQRKVEVVELTRLATLYKRPITFFTGEATDAPAAPPSSLPSDVELLARKASKLTPKDRAELTRFADFLRMRTEADRDVGGNGGGERKGDK